MKDLDELDGICVGLLEEIKAGVVADAEDGRGRVDGINVSTEADDGVPDEALVSVVTVAGGGCKLLDATSDMVQAEEDILEKLWVAGGAIRDGVVEADEVADEQTWTFKVFQALYSGSISKLYPSSNLLLYKARWLGLRALSSIRKPEMASRKPQAGETREEKDVGVAETWSISSSKLDWGSDAK